jgi:hypothetical protein
MSAERPLNSVEAWFGGKSPEDLAFVEAGGRTYYPDTIKRRRASKPDDLDETPVFFRVPSAIETARARVVAMRLVAKVVGVEKFATLREAQDAIGPALFDDFENAAILSESLFVKDSQTSDPRQWMLLESMLEIVPRASISEAWEKLNFYLEAEDPRVAALDVDTMIALATTIAAKGASPLAAMAGPVRNACVRFMAARLVSCPTCSSSSPSAETSTPES